MQQSLIIPEEYCGKRFDQALSAMLPQYSRSRLQRWIKEGRVLVNGVNYRPKDIIHGGEVVEVSVTDAAGDDDYDAACEAQDLPVVVVYADDDLIVVDKAAGMVVHPAAGHRSGTLQNALLFRYPELNAIPRAGIVHRLDKDTSGLMVVARSLRAHAGLAQQLQTRQMGRQYEAVVHGVMVAGGVIDAPIGRCLTDRKRMAVQRNGKPAVTHYRVLQKFRRHAHVGVKLETGRTHQIRVHMAHIKHPLVGDRVYGGRQRTPAKASQHLLECLQSLSGQALHATQLELRHPATDVTMRWQSALPDTIRRLLELLRRE